MHAESSVNSCRCLPLLLSVLSILFLTNCTLAPLSAPDEAFSLGRGQTRYEIHAVPVPAFAFSVGAIDRLDLGVQVEAHSEEMFMLWGKLSLLDNPFGGVSLAGYGGVFYGNNSWNTRGYQVGPMLSFRAEKIMVSGMLRYNHVEFDDNNGDSPDSEYYDDDWWDNIFTDGSSEGDYLQADLTFRHIINSHFSMKYGCTCLFDRDYNKESGRDEEACQGIVGFRFTR